MGVHGTLWRNVTAITDNSRHLVATQTSRTEGSAAEGRVTVNTVTHSSGIVLGRVNAAGITRQVKRDSMPDWLSSRTICLVLTGAKKLVAATVSEHGRKDNTASSCPDRRRRALVMIVHGTPWRFVAEITSKSRHPVAAKTRHSEAEERVAENT